MVAAVLSGISGLFARRAAPRGSPEVPADRVDRVHFSVTSPPAVAPGSAFVVDVWAHLDGDRDRVLARAREQAAGEPVAIRTQGPAPVARGVVLTVSLRIDGLTVDPADETIHWTGEVGNAGFAVAVPADAANGDRAGTAAVSVGGLRVARVQFVVRVGAAAGKSAALPVREERHRKAFASYASPDREAVLARVQGLQKAAPGLEVFLDVLSLRPGQDWAAELRRVIPANDVFYLFWSAHARQSEWVEREWRCALETRGLDFIDPVPLAPPDVAPPPHELAGKHFNDWVLAFMRRPGPTG